MGLPRDKDGNILPNWQEWLEKEVYRTADFAAEAMRKHPEGEVKIQYYTSESLRDPEPLKARIVELIRKAPKAKDKEAWDKERKDLEEEALFFSFPALLFVYNLLRSVWDHRRERGTIAKAEKRVADYPLGKRVILASDPAAIVETIKAIREDREPIKVEFWAPLPQERITNDLTKPNTYLPLIEKKGTAIESWAETFHNHLVLKADNEKTLKALTPATFQFLDFLLLKAHKINNFSSFSVSVSEYMEARGLKDRKAAKEQIKRAISTLFNVRITYNSKLLTKAEKRSVPKGFPLDIEFRVLDAKSTLNARGDIGISFSKIFSPLIASAPPMAYHAALLKVNTHTNPNAHAFGRKLLEAFNMSIERKRVEIEAGRYEVILGVDTLLAVSSLPDVETVRADLNRSARQRIIEPFERDLNALSDMGRWEYCKAGGVALEADDRADDYETFSRLYVRFTFHDYPQQTRRLQHFAEKVEKRKRLELARAAGAGAAAEKKKKAGSEEGGAAV